MNPKIKAPNCSAWSLIGINALTALSVLAAPAICQSTPEISLAASGPDMSTAAAAEIEPPTAANLTVEGEIIEIYLVEAPVPSSEQLPVAEAEAIPVLFTQLADETPVADNGSPKFGTAGTQRWYLQGGAAADFDNDAFGLVGAGISHFVFNGHSINLELNGLVFDQVGDDAAGLNLAFLVRSHWIRGENWSLYVDGGAGIIVSTDQVPSAGSSFNFTPQVGGGATIRLNDRQQLMTGLRWYHISNADTFESNPGLDTVYGYVGINFPL